MSTTEAQKELAALLRSLASLVGSVGSALADGLVSVDELVKIGADIPALITAIADLARPNAPAEKIEAARVKVRAARKMMRKVRRLRMQRRVVVG